MVMMPIKRINMPIKFTTYKVNRENRKSARHQGIKRDKKRPTDWSVPGTLLLFRLSIAFFRYPKGKVIVAEELEDFD